MSSETCTASATTVPNMRRRRTGRADAFSYLTASLTQRSRSKLAHIHEVVCYSIWLDLIGFQIGNVTPNQFSNSRRYPYFAPRMKACLADEILKISYDLGDAIYAHQAKERIMVFVSTMSDEEPVAFLESCQSSRFYSDMMNNQIGFVQDLRVLSTMPHAHADQERVRISRSCYTFDMRKSLGLDLKDDDTKVYDHSLTLNEDRLISFLKIIRKLRTSIAIAASASHLPKDLLATLKMRLQEFDRRSLYSLACSTVVWDSPEEPYLVADSETWWSVARRSLRLSTDMDRSTSSNGPDDTAVPDKVVLAYTAGNKMRSNLTFMVPIVCLLSVIPAAAAWKHGDSVPGSTSDSNFWQAVSGSIMQLLGLVTFTWPAWKIPRLSQQLTWVWIWMLAGFSAICAVVSVPLYLVFPTVWSFVVSFAGVLAQFVVQLQVVHAM